MKPLTLSILAAATLLAAGVVAWSPWRDAQPAARADAAVVTTLAIDMDPNDGGGSPINDDHTVGAIQQCVSVAAGANVTFDVVLCAGAACATANAIAAVDASDLAGYQYFMGFDPLNLSFSGQSSAGSGKCPGAACLAPNGIHIIQRAQTGAGACPLGPAGGSCSGPSGCLDTQEGVPDPPDTTGDPGIHQAFIADGSDSWVGNSACDTWGKNGGVLGRYHIDTTGAAAGIYGITLDASAVFAPKVNDTAGGHLWDRPDDGIDNDGDTQTDEDLKYDATTGYGLIAVDVPCSEGPPEPTATASPTPTPSPTPSPSPSPSPTPAPGLQQIDLASGWNNICYLGAARPIEEALADIEENVLAVYRLRAGQGYDRWFPGRPDVSTITTLASYEPLFILMASSASWTQQGQASPPMATSLSEGWNNVCYTGQTKDAASATTAIEGKFAVLYVLGSDQSWRRFVPGRPEVSNLSQLVHLEPVVILVTQPGGSQWTFDA